MPDTDRRTILIVEDEPAHAELLKIHLSASGYRWDISLASSLNEYSELISDIRPDVVLADINLPDGSSLSLLQPDHEKRQWPVIIMTSYGDHDMATDAISAGAADFIVKSPETFRNMSKIVLQTLDKWKPGK